MTDRAVAAAVVAAVAMMAAGCGGEDKSSAPDCGAAALDRAALAVVDKAYQAGKLGDQMQVRQSLGASFFTSGGDLKPYDSLSVLQRRRLDRWMRGDGTVRTVTGDDRRAAEMAVLRRCGQNG